MHVKVLESQWVDLAIVRKRPDVFEGVLELLESKGLMDIISFKQDWCAELIMQFYATCYFGNDPDRTVFWMTDGTQYKFTYDEWAEILGLDGFNAPRKKLHETGSSVKVDGLALLYPPQTPSSEFGLASLMLPKYFHIHKILRPVFIGKGGDKGRMWDYALDIMHFMAQSEKFHIFDYIYNEIRRATLVKRSLPYAPFIMALIVSSATHLGEIHMECKHNPYKPRVGEVDKVRLAKATEPAFTSSSHAAPPKKVSKWQKFVSQGFLACFTSARNNALEIEQLKHHHNSKYIALKAQLRDTFVTPALHSLPTPSLPSLWVVCPMSLSLVLGLRSTLSLYSLMIPWMLWRSDLQLVTM